MEFISAEKFNAVYSVGSEFIWQPIGFLQGGMRVKTIDVAYGDNETTVVRINNPTKSVD